jgi:hypothetical protein
MFVATVLHYSWEGRTSEDQIWHLKKMARKKPYSDKIIFQDVIILRSKSIAELIIRISVWLDSYTAHKIHKIFIIITIVIIIIIIIIITVIEFSLGGSSPYTSTDKTNKNKYT